MNTAAALLLTSTAGLWLGFASPAVEAAVAPKPNIVFILADDLGYGDLGCYGQTKIRTPNLDRLAAEGMRFTQHYSGSAVCAPSRCVLMTGKHPGHAFIRDNSEVGEWYSYQGQIPLPAATTTIAKALKSAGYATGAFGKWGLGGVGSSGDPMKQGFDRFFGYNCQRHAHNYYPRYLVDNESQLLLPGNAQTVKETKLSLPENADASDPASYAAYKGAQYAPDLCCEQALQFIRQQKDRPFFVYYATTIPHLALQVPEDSLAEYRDKFGDTPYRGDGGYLPQQYPRAAYAAMITRMDRHVGQLMGLVKQLGLEENTVFVFTSDNGAVYSLGGYDPAFFHSTGGLRGFKGSVYEGGVREPCIVRWKGRIGAASTSDRVTGFEDWLPTLLELTGAKGVIPPGIDGLSFAPTLLGHKQAPRPFLYREYPGYGGQQSLRISDWKGVRQKLLATKSGPSAQTQVELYDLAHDPGETKDLAKKHPEIVAQMERVLREQHVLSKEFPFPVLDQAPKEP